MRKKRGVWFTGSVATLVSLACNSATPVAQTYIAGTVANEAGVAIAGAKLTIATTDKVLATDAQGNFVFSGEGFPSPAHVTAAAPGFAPRTFRILQTQNTSNNAYVMLRATDTAAAVKVPTGQDVPVTVAATHGDGQATLEIMANTLVRADGTPASGEAKIEFTYWSPKLSLRACPGQLVTVDPNDVSKEVSLTTFGMADILVTQEGQPLTLAPGATASLKFTVPKDLLSDDLAHFPLPFLYVFNQDTARWDFEGSTADKRMVYDAVAGTFTASLPHFSSWNLDRPNDPAHASCVSGRVISACTGQPLPNHDLTLWLMGWEDLGTVGARSGADGKYCQNIPVNDRSAAVPHNWAAIFASNVDDPNDTSTCGNSGPILPKACFDTRNVTGVGCRYQIDFQVPNGKTTFDDARYLQADVPALPTCVHSGVSDAECHQVCNKEQDANTRLPIVDLVPCNACPNTSGYRVDDASNGCYGMGDNQRYTYDNKCVDLGDVAINDGTCPKYSQRSKSCDKRANASLGDPCDASVPCPCCPCNGPLVCRDQLCVTP